MWPQLCQIPSVFAGVLGKTIQRMERRLAARACAPLKNPFEHNAARKRGGNYALDNLYYSVGFVVVGASEFVHDGRIYSHSVAHRPGCVGNSATERTQSHIVGVG